MNKQIKNSRNKNYGNIGVAKKVNRQDSKKEQYNSEKPYKYYYNKITSLAVTSAPYNYCAHNINN